MYDNITINKLYSIDSQQGTPSDATEIDYDLLYDTYYNAFYDALNDYYNESEVSVNGNNNIDTSSVDFRSSTSQIEIDSNTSSDALLEFSSSTDATMYTVGVASPPTSSGQATQMYLLEIRNILLIFVLTWVSVTLYSKIKNLMINYMTKN